jgi:hypothetical protein
MPLSCVAAALGSNLCIAAADHGLAGTRSQSKRAPATRFVPWRRANSGSGRRALASPPRELPAAAEHPNILGLVALAPPLGRT